MAAIEYLPNSLIYPRRVRVHKQIIRELATKVISEANDVDLNHQSFAISVYKTRKINDL